MACSSRARRSKVINLPLQYTTRVTRAGIDAAVVDSLRGSRPIPGPQTFENRFGMAQQALGREDHQRFCARCRRLPPQQMEVFGPGVVQLARRIFSWRRTAQRKRSMRGRSNCSGPLTFVTIGSSITRTRRLAPFSCSAVAMNWSIHTCATVGEIAELRLPKMVRVKGVCHAVAGTRKPRHRIIRSGEPIQHGRKAPRWWKAMWRSGT